MLPAGAKEIRLILHPDPSSPMKHSLPSLLGVALALLYLSGCAGVQIHDSAGKDTDIPVRMPETYLLVSPPDDAGKVTIQVITLPTGKRLYLTPKAGIGSSSLEFTLVNGALASWGSETDSQVADTITALTGVVTSMGAPKGPDVPDRQKPSLYRVVVDESDTRGPIKLVRVEGF